MGKQVESRLAAVEVQLPFSRSSEEYNDGMYGECYRAALFLAFEHCDDPAVDEITICHGAVTGSRGEVLGRRILHAWCECRVLIEVEHCGHKHTASIPMCVDAAVPEIETQVLPMVHYYRAAEVVPDDVRRYDVRQAFEIAAKVGHCGPWERPLSEVWDWDGTAENERYTDEGLIVSKYGHEAIDLEIARRYRRLLEERLRKVGR